jgi:hypothetical protein
MRKFLVCPLCGNIAKVEAQYDVDLRRTTCAAHLEHQVSEMTEMSFSECANLRDRIRKETEEHGN